MKGDWRGRTRRVVDLMTTITPIQMPHHPCRWMMLCLWAVSLCPKVVANPVVDEKARSLESDAHVVAVVVKLKTQNKKYQRPAFDIFFA
jgi:hypothetical protein